MFLASIACVSFLLHAVYARHALYTQEARPILPFSSLSSLLMAGRGRIPHAFQLSRTASHQPFAAAGNMPRLRVGKRQSSGMTRPQRRAASIFMADLSKEEKVKIAQEAADKERMKIWRLSKIGPMSEENQKVADAILDMKRQEQQVQPLLDLANKFGKDRYSVAETPEKTPEELKAEEEQRKRKEIEKTKRKKITLWALKKKKMLIKQSTTDLISIVALLSLLVINLFGLKNGVSVAIGGLVGATYQKLSLEKKVKQYATEYRDTDSEVLPEFADVVSSNFPPLLIPLLMVVVGAKIESKTELVSVLPLILGFLTEQIGIIVNVIGYKRHYGLLPGVEESEDPVRGPLWFLYDKRGMSPEDDEIRKQFEDENGKKEENKYEGYEQWYQGGVKDPDAPVAKYTRGQTELEALKKGQAAERERMQEVWTSFEEKNRSSPITR